MSFSTFGFNYPDRAIFLLDNIVNIEEPLMLQTIDVDDREILLTGITIFINPFDIISCFTKLFKQYLRCRAN